MFHGAEIVKPYGLLTLVIALLHHLRRVSYRALRLQFDLDDEQLEALKFELVEALRLAVDVDGKMLFWTGGDQPSVVNIPAPDAAARGPAVSAQLPPSVGAPVTPNIVPPAASDASPETAVESPPTSPNEPPLAAEAPTPKGTPGAAPGIDPGCGPEMVSAPPRQPTLAVETGTPEVTPAAVSDNVPEPAVGVSGAQRRQLTVMFCDLVGSTPLSEQLDPEELRDLLRDYQEACHRAIDQFEGHIARYFGDGLLVYFGYPRAHEDDAQRAVHSGLEILQEMERLNAALRSNGGVRLDVRIGIHTGLVVVGDMDEEQRLESMAIVGDTPNVAARVQGLAQPNTVVITAATARLVRSVFSLEELGAHELKGVAEPVALARVVGPVVEQTEWQRAQAERTVPLVGRDEELGLLLRRWGQSKEGLGQVVLVNGQGGIGKTSLMETVRDAVAREGYPRIAFYCSPYHTNSALYPVISHLERFLRIHLDDPPAAKLDKLEQVLRSYSFPLEEVVPLFAALLSIPLLDRFRAPQLTPKQLKQQTLDALVAWLFEEAERQPLLVIWEDLQWADPSTIEMLDLFIDQVPTAPLLSVLTCRPEFVSPWSSRSHMTPITLNRLERPHMEAMIAHLANGKPLPREVIEHVVTKTDGVPLYVEEITKMILESDALREEEDRFVLTGALSDTIPATLQDSLMARLDRSPTVRELAQIGAVLGREFPFEMIQPLAALDEEALQDRLAKLVDAELLYQRGRGARARYMFKHALIRDAAYSSLLKSRRQHYHEQTARMIETRLPEIVETQPELVAHHYAEAGRHEQAIRYWQRAGERALGRSATIEAINHLKKGLEWIEVLSDEGERTYYELRLLTTLGPALMTTAGYAAEETQQVYTRARDLCRQAGETPELFPILAGLWRFHLLRGGYSQAEEFAEQLLALAERLGNPEFLLEAYRALGSTLFYRGELAKSRVHLEQGVGLYDPQLHGSMALRYGQDPAVACRAYGGWVLWLLGYPDQAEEQSRKAIALAEEIKHPFSRALALSFATWLHQFRREKAVTRERAEAALTLSTEHGFQFWIGWDTVMQCWAQAGEAPDGEVLGKMRDGLEAWLATGSGLGRPYFLALLAEVNGLAETTEDGLNLLTEALDVAGQTGERWWEAELLRMKGELLLCRNGTRDDEVEQCFHEAIDLARQQQTKALELRAAVSLARLWQNRGKPEKGRQTLSQVYNWFTEGHDSADLKEAQALLEELG